MSVTVPAAQPISPAGYTPVTKFGAALIEAMAPWLTLHLCWLLDAVGSMADPYYQLVMDRGFDGDPGYVPGYGTLFDPSTCPAIDLPYLSQYVGVQIPAGTDDATARSLVEAEAGLNRATDSAVLAAAKRNLVGTQFVDLVPRERSDGTPDAAWFGLVVHAEEVVSVQALKDAVNAVKLGGLVWWLAFGVPWSLNNMEASQATLGALEAAFVTLTGLETDQAGI